MSKLVMYRTHNFGSGRNRIQIFFSYQDPAGSGYQTKMAISGRIRNRIVSPIHHYSGLVLVRLTLYFKKVIISLNFKFGVVNQKVLNEKFYTKTYH